MEIVRVESLDRAHGTQIGIAYELRWKLDGTVLELVMDGGPGTRVELGDADFSTCSIPRSSTRCPSPAMGCSPKARPPASTPCGSCASPGWPQSQPGSGTSR
jgi:hypothetical protein